MLGELLIILICLIIIIGVYFNFIKPNMFYIRYIIRYVKIIISYFLNKYEFEIDIIVYVLAGLFVLDNLSIQDLYTIAEILENIIKFQIIYYLVTSLHMDIIDKDRYSPFMLLIFCFIDFIVLLLIYIISWLGVYGLLTYDIFFLIIIIMIIIVMIIISFIKK